MSNEMVRGASPWAALGEKKPENILGGYLPAPETWGGLGPEIVELDPSEEIVQTITISFEGSLSFNIIVEKDTPGFHAYVPAMKGIHVDGESVQETWMNVYHAITAYVESLQRHGHTLPPGAGFAVELKQGCGATCQLAPNRS